MKKIILVLTGISLFSFTYASGKTDHSFYHDSLEILTIKNQIIEIEEKIDTLQKKINLGNEALKQSVDTYSTAKEFINIKESSIHWFASICVIISCFGLFAGVKLFRRHFNNKIEELINENKKTLNEMVKKHHKEKFLLDNSKILIINKKNTSIEITFSMILKRFQCTPTLINTTILNDFDYGLLEKHDVIILDNNNLKNEKEKNWNFSADADLKNKLINIVKTACSNGNAFLYFGNFKEDGQFADHEDLKEFCHLINYSNKPATLFANLIDLLDFRNILKEQMV